ncbi:MAG TPA: GNAT family N-acetyltransferase [Kineosporiaceae bacterium]|nr:GNAT family N-acetyltransferase [Kineosporiaceae bacterium]
MNCQVIEVDQERLAHARGCAARALAGERDQDDLVALVGADDPFKAHMIRLQAVDGDDVVGTAIGHLEGPNAYLDLVAVEPARQGEGIGRALLQAYEARARELGATSSALGGSVRSYAWPGVEMRRTAALAMALRHGYRRSQVAFNMWVDLDEVHAPEPSALQRLTARGIVVRRATPDDIPGLRALARAITLETADDDAAAAAPVPPEESEASVAAWGEELELGVRGARSSVQIAVVDDAIRAFAAQGVYRSGMFGPMGTAADMRGTGVGAVLLRSSLSDLRHAGARRADIGWIADDALPFYARTVGARCGAAFWVLTKTLPVEG